MTSHRPHEEMFQEGVRGRASEATYSPPSQGTQYSSLAHEAGSRAEGQQKTMAPIGKLRYLDGTRPSFWTSHMECYLDNAAVQGEVARLRVAGTQR